MGRIIAGSRQIFPYADVVSNTIGSIAPISMFAPLFNPHHRFIVAVDDNGNSFYFGGFPEKDERGREYLNVIQYSYSKSVGDRGVIVQNSDYSAELARSLISGGASGSDGNIEWREIYNGPDVSNYVDIMSVTANKIKEKKLDYSAPIQNGSFASANSNSLFSTLLDVLNKHVLWSALPVDRRMAPGAETRLLSQAETRQVELEIEGRPISVPDYPQNVDFSNADNVLNGTFAALSARQEPFDEARQDHSLQMGAQREARRLSVSARFVQDTFDTLAAPGGPLEQALANPERREAIDREVKRLETKKSLEQQDSVAPDQLSSLSGLQRAVPAHSPQYIEKTVTVSNPAFYRKTKTADQTSAGTPPRTIRKTVLVANPDYDPAEEAAVRQRRAQAAADLRRQDAMMAQMRHMSARRLASSQLRIATAQRNTYGDGGGNGSLSSSV